MSVAEDPIFDPWSALEPIPEPSDARGPTADPSTSEVPPVGLAHVLRAIAAPRIEAIRGRLDAARHETSVQDLLDAPPHLLRLELTPWAGPLAGARQRRTAMLEIGFDAASPELVTAWYWLDREESPDGVMSVPAAQLSASWVDRVALGFVRSVLARR